MSPSPRRCLTLVSHFFRRHRDRSWHAPWPGRHPHFFLDGTHWHFNFIYQQFLNACTCKWTQFKHGGHRWWRRRWFSSNYRCHCLDVLLSARATFTDNCSDLNRRAAQRIQLTYGSSSSVNVGSGNHCVVNARYRPFYAKVLCMYLVVPVPLMCAHVFCLRYNAQDPNDPTTFPNFQAPSPPPVYPRNSMESPSGPPPFSGKSPYIVNPAPNSQGQAPGYGGLPEP